MVDSLPVALAASMIVLAAIAGLMGLGLSRAQPMVSTASVDVQLSELADGCGALLASSPRDLLDPASVPGASKAIELVLPADTEYVSFGTDGAEGVVVYGVHGTKKVVAIGDVRLRKGMQKGGIMVPSDEHYVIEGGGRYEFTIEYEYDRGLNKKYLIFY